jgi:hypothetical protein
VLRTPLLRIIQRSPILEPAAPDPPVNTASRFIHPLQQSHNFSNHQVCNIESSGSGQQSQDSRNHHVCNIQLKLADRIGNIALSVAPLGDLRVPLLFTTKKRRKKYGKVNTMSQIHSLQIVVAMLLVSVPGFHGNQTGPIESERTSLASHSCELYQEPFL